MKPHNDLLVQALLLNAKDAITACQLLRAGHGYPCRCPVCQEADGMQEGLLDSMERIQSANVPVTTN